MHPAYRLIVEQSAKLRSPKYRDAFTAEFNVPARTPGWPDYICALWVEAFLNDLSREWGMRGRAGW